MVAGILANIVAMATILRTWTPHNHHNILIFNLSLVDLGIMLFSMTFSVGSFFDNGAALRENPALCRVRSLTHAHLNLSLWIFRISVSLFHFIIFNQKRIKIV